MILWIEPILDRTSADVSRVHSLSLVGWENMTSDQKTEWLSGMKGALNKADLERIENNIQLLSDVLELELETYYGNVPDIPTNVYFAKMIENVEKIRTAYGKKSTTPITPAAPLNGYQKINDVEQILQDVYDLLNNNFSYYCGEGLMAGQDTALLL